MARKLRASITPERGAVEAEGFGIVTEIDFKATLKKIGADGADYLILGARNPKMAHEAMMI
jgi:uncharacterized protein (DUF302 family)